MFDEYGIGYSTISGEIDNEVGSRAPFLLSFVVVPLLFVRVASPSSSDGVGCFGLALSHLVVQVTGSGRHFVGLTRDFHRLPNLISTIDFSSSGGSAPMTLRVKNGQQIEVDISFQFVLPKASVLALYRDFKHNYLRNFRKTAESSFRLVAAKYHAEEFFHNRTTIGASRAVCCEPLIAFGFFAPSCCCTLMRLLRWLMIQRLTCWRRCAQRSKNAMPAWWVCRFARLTCLTPSRIVWWKSS